MSESDGKRTDSKPRGSSVPWYADGLRFECQKCGRCCRGEPGVVWVSKAEIEKISAHLGISPGEFRTKYVRRVGFRLSLKELDNGDCVLYQNGCVVYPVRPAQCRTFPFWSEALRSREWYDEVLENCPGKGKGRLYSREEIEEILRGGSAAEGDDGDGRLGRRQG